MGHQISGTAIGHLLYLLVGIPCGESLDVAGKVRLPSSEYEVLRETDTKSGNPSLVLMLYTANVSFPYQFYQLLVIS